MAFLSVESSFSSSNSLRAANSAHSSIVHGRDGRRENDAMECLLDRFITMSESKMYVIICFVRDHDTRFSLGFLHPALHSTQGDLYNTYQPREQQK